MADFEAFMQKVMEKSLPNDALARFRTYAKEVALGAIEERWSSDANVNETNLREYIKQRWNHKYPDLRVLQTLGYLGDKFQLTAKAYNLLDEVEPSTIFISYRRRESSAFALLVLARLKEHGLGAFLDMSIKPGDNWHAHIKEQIESHDFFIVLLNHETLDSDVVRDEIQWAMDANKAILPIAHPVFDYAEYKILKTAEDKFKVSSEMDSMLTNTHTIRVLEESALAYNTAIIELLNRFGITP